LRAALEAAGFEVVAETGDARSAARTAESLRPDVCLLDVNMPGSGIEAARAITVAVPDTQVVMLTVSRDDDDLFNALKAGAVGYLLKDMDPARLPATLEGVLKGEAALPRTLVTRLIAEFQGRPTRRLFRRGRLGEASLTEREWQALELMKEGYDTAEIAERMSVTPVTIRTYVAAILRKLQVPDRQAAIDLLDE